jgi:hypothetical protein
LAAAETNSVASRAGSLSRAAVDSAGGGSTERQSGANMPGRGPQTFKKRQKEQERKEKRAEKLARRHQKKDEKPAEPLTNSEVADRSPEEVAPQ